MILVYNLLLVALDLGLVAAWRRQCTGKLWLSGLALAGAAMLALGDLAMALVPDDPYYGPRCMLYGCLAWGIFLHGTFLLDPRGRIRWQEISYTPFMDAKFFLDECRRLLSLSR